MNKNNEVWLKLLFWLVLFLYVGLMCFYLGMEQGERKLLERQDKKQCELEFSNSPQKDIDGECLKYFLE